jgi:hypothetical protein
MSKRRHEGYLIVDHRASPGNALAGEGQVYETPTVTCSHCGSVVILSPTRTRPRHYCFKCDHYVCDKAVCILECRPWMKIIEAAEREAHHGIIF